MKFSKKIFIGKRAISIKHPSYFIADIAANHDGDLKRAKDLIWMAKEAGADAAKFQHFLAKKIVSDYGFKKLGKIAHQRKWKSSVFEIYDRYSLNREWNHELIKTAKKAKIDFFTTPYDYDAVNEIDKYVKVYKIGSGDITWIDFIKFIAKKKKPIFFASGASEISDITRAIKVLLKINNKLCLMQCNTNYTDSINNYKYINLNVLNLFKKKFPNIILGLSDHTQGHTTVLGAITLGARVIEKHFTDKNDKKGPDHLFSMNPKSWKEMILKSRELEYALGDGKKKVEKNEIDSFICQRRCVRLSENIKKGERISISKIDFLRPAPRGSIPPYEYKKLIGLKFKKEKKKGMAIYQKDLISNSKKISKY